MTHAASTWTRGARDVQELLASYPRRRPPLPDAYKAIYEREYLLNRTGGTRANSLALRAEAWMHRAVAKRGGPGSVLEIGAGTLNHLPYEAAGPYDVVEPFTALYAQSAHRARVRRFYSSVHEVPSSTSYDRVISVAVLEHIEDLPTVVARSALLLSEHGIAQHAIPSEGGALWGLAWRLTTGLAYRRRNGLSYGVAMRHEHINDAVEIIAIVRWFFRQIRLQRFPFAPHHTSLYTYIEARDPRRDRCRQYLGLPDA